eukprot:scaffold2141_cov282-Pinguiococcus_pyrenoidosus.AAC.41
MARSLPGPDTFVMYAAASVDSRLGLTGRYGEPNDVSVLSCDAPYTERESRRLSLVLPVL